MKGGLEADYVGYWIDFRGYQMGLSESRAKWLVEWLGRKATEGSMLIRDLKELLGRLSFAAGPLRFLRPFLGPLFAWSVACPSGSYAEIPTMLRTLMLWLQATIQDRRVVNCRDLHPVWRGELIRTDAKAEGDVVCLGG